MAVKIEQPTDKLFQGVSEALRSLPGIEAIIASLAWTHEMTLTAVAELRMHSQWYRMVWGLFK